MAKVIYVHGVGGGPGRAIAAALRHAGHQVHDPLMPYHHSHLGPILAPLQAALKKGVFGIMQAAQNAPATLAQLRELFEASIQKVQAEIEAFNPEVVIGNSLGATVALCLPRDRLPHILGAPIWNPHIKPGFIRHFISFGGMDKLVEMFWPVVMSNAPRHWEQFQVPPHAQPATVILHSPGDEAFDLEQSATLLDNSPVPAADPFTAFLPQLAARFPAGGAVVVDAVDARLLHVLDPDPPFHPLHGPGALAAFVSLVDLLTNSAVSSR